MVVNQPQFTDSLKPMVFHTPHVNNTQLTTLTNHQMSAQTSMFAEIAQDQHHLPMKLALITVGQLTINITMHLDIDQ